MATVIPSSFQFRDCTENHRAFSRDLRSAPTAAIDRYRALYATRERWSKTDELYFFEATQILGSTLTYKDWEAHVFPDQPLVSRRDFLNGFSVGVESISADIWFAFVNTELPLFWLDVTLERNPLDDTLTEKMLQCLITFTYIWSQELGKGPEKHRDGISSAFANLYFEKFSKLYTMLWESREQLGQHIFVNLLGRTAHDLAYIHNCLRLPGRLLENGKLAHLSLWTLCNREPILLRETAAERDLGAFDTVYSHLCTTRGGVACSRWLREIVKALGPDKLMDVLGLVIFRSSKINRPLEAFAKTMDTVISDVPECLLIVYRDPLTLIQDGLRALDRQLEGNIGEPLVPVRWTQNMQIWQTLYKLCFIPHEALVRMTYARACEITGAWLDLQARGVTMMLEIWRQKTIQAGLNAGATATAISKIDERLGVIYSQTASLTAHIASGVQAKRDAALVFRKAYGDGARDGWIHTAKLLRDARSKYGLEISYRQLVRYWVEVGKCLGLREAVGLLQLDRTCSNPPCQYHLIPAENALSMCKGCQEERYCSRECQKRDWKERHRIECRRLQTA